VTGAWRSCGGWASGLYVDVKHRRCARGSLASVAVAVIIVVIGSRQCGFGRRVAADCRARCGGRLTNGIGVAQIGVDRRDNDTRFNRDQVNANQGDAHPCVDDDPLVENAIEHVDETGSARSSLNGHSLIPDVGCGRAGVDGPGCPASPSSLRSTASEIRVQLRFDPGHPSAKEILQERDLSGVGIVSRRELRPAAEVSIGGITDLGGHPIDDAVEVVG
jgi:hypothetical protein